MMVARRKEQQQQQYGSLLRSLSLLILAAASFFIVPENYGAAAAADDDAPKLVWRAGSDDGSTAATSTSATSLVHIDYDAPRYGPLCLSVDAVDTLEFVWQEYHNLHQLLDATAYETCDFSAAIPWVPQGQPRPAGYQIAPVASIQTAAMAMAVSDHNDTVTGVRYFSCSKICARNGHKVKICTGGHFGENNACSLAIECTEDRTSDLRRRQLPHALQPDGQPVLVPAVPVPVRPRRTYSPVGTVCRPKNSDGYAIESGIDTPESCQQKCDQDAPKCGAWEFENHDVDHRECELHEATIISYHETLTMGACDLPPSSSLSSLSATNSSLDDIDDEIAFLQHDYRCCWILQDVIDEQQQQASDDDDEEPIEDQAVLSSDQYRSAATSSSSAGRRSHNPVLPPATKTNIVLGIVLWSVCSIVKIMFAATVTILL